MRLERATQASGAPRGASDLIPERSEPDPWVGLGRGTPLDQARNSESSLTMLRLGMAPISRFFSTPPMNRASVGMLMTP
jgi:hypothetical protein